MTDLTFSMEFPSPTRKQIVAEFDGGNISSDAGALLLRNADRKLGLTHAMASVLKDERDQNRICHTYLDLLRQRIFAIALGYEDANDANALRSDPVMKLACDRMPDSDPALGSQASVSRLENQPGEEVLNGLEEVQVRTVIRQLPRKTRKVIIDADPTDDPCHGRQEKRAYNGYYNETCFLPLFIHVTAEDGRQRIIAGRLRAGNAGATRGFDGLLEMIVRLLRERFPKTRIILRADSAFGNADVLKLCHRLDIRYILGLRSNRRIEELAAPFEEKAIRRFTAGDEDRLVLGHFSYGAKIWQKEERVIIKGEMDGLVFKARYLVSDLRGKPEKLYAFYSRRGDHENRIKEMKLDMKSGRTSCQKFNANRFRLLLHVAACILLTAVQDAAAGTEWARSTLGQFRLRLMKVAARVIESHRRVKISLPTCYPLKDVWREMHTHLCA